MRVIYTTEDGGVAIVTAAPKADLKRALGPLTDEEYQAHVLERSIPEGATDVVILPDDWTPPVDRTFRDAWRRSGDSIEVDMSAARDIHRDRLRAVRKKRLEALDVESIRASEANDRSKVEEVARKKQALRDVPAHPAIEHARTPEDLSGISIDDLLDQADRLPAA